MHQEITKLQTQIEEFKVAEEKKPTSSLAEIHADLAQKIGNIVEQIESKNSSRAPTGHVYSRAEDEENGENPGTAETTGEKVM